MGGQAGGLPLHGTGWKGGLAATPRSHSAVIELWPDAADLSRILRSERTNTTGLYTGIYRPEVVIKGVTRHTIYCDTILLIDPFTNPRRIRDKFNPLLHPEQYRTTALMGANLWLNMAPWIAAGMVRFIRTPADFDRRLEWEGYAAQDRRALEHPELIQLREQMAEREVNEDTQMIEYYILHESDKQLEVGWREYYPDSTEDEVKRYVDYMRRRREEHPLL